jgi:hypothetical protein
MGKQRGRHLNENYGRKRECSIVQTEPYAQLSILMETYEMICSGFVKCLFHRVRSSGEYEEFQCKL